MSRPRTLSLANRDATGSGFTLFELVVVVGILVLVTGAALGLGATVTERSRTDATRASLVALRTAIAGSAGSPGFLQDVGALPTTVRDLFVLPEHLPNGETTRPFDPIRRRGWDGPYLAVSTGRYAVAPEHGFTTLYGAPGDPCVLDPWGNPIVLQVPVRDDTRTARLVSAGANGVLETPPGVPLPADAAFGDDVFTFLVGAAGGGADE